MPRLKQLKQKSDTMPTDEARIREIGMLSRAYIEMEAALQKEKEARKAEKAALRNMQEQLAIIENSYSTLR